MPGRSPDAPLIATARLVLAPLGEHDLEALQALNALPEVRRFLFDDEVWTLEETRDRLLVENARLWAEEGYGLFTMRHPDASDLLGWVGFWYFHEPPVLEVGYALHPGVWGRGYATEAAGAVMAWGARVHGMVAFRASTDAPNEASLRVLSRLGFREVARTPGRAHETVHLARDGAPAAGGA